MDSTHFRPQFSPRLIVLSAIAAALASAAVIYHLNQMTERSHEARLGLTQAKEYMSRLNSLEWEAISKGEIDENLVEEIDENRQNIQVMLRHLESVDHRQKNRFSIISIIKNKNFKGLYRSRDGDERLSAGK